ncbi:hypothetical protein Y032_1242g3778, partial [Ancylostoma ceylanicum]
MASRLGATIRSSIRDQISEVSIVSDSEIALYWLKSTKKLPTFVANQCDRIKAIQNDILKGDISTHYYHVVTSHNPADAGTRGLTAIDIANHDWVRGPRWLEKDNTTWPIKSINAIQIPEEDESVSIIPAMNAEIADEDNVHQCIFQLARYAHLNKALRVTATVGKLLHKWVVRTNEHRQRNIALSIISKFDLSSEILSSDIETSEEILLVQEQQHWSISELQNRYHNKNVVRDEKGILRHESRLQNAAIPFDTKSPIFIPHESGLTRLILQKIHLDNAHSGKEHTLTIARQKYWIPRASNAFQKYLKNCQICKRYQGLPLGAPAMPSLPKDRVIATKPFENTGCDFMGPFLSKTEEKMYVCLFTCLTTRAVHLELVENMTTGEFLNSFMRFVSRRGVPKIMRTDCGTNFKHGEKIIATMFEKNDITNTSLMSYCATEKIKWLFNTPSAPWMGGVWERLVGSVKRALNKCIGRKKLAFTEMYTVLTKIEAILNTRPLTKLNTEDITKIPLRPIDFLQGNVKFSIPNATDFDIDDPSYDPEFIQTEQQAMEAVQFAENIATKFWESWRMEYLTSLRDSQRLQLKQPRHLTRKHPEIGEIVIIEQDLTPRGNWPYGKITEIITSKDGLVRSAKILMPNHKVIQRPLNKIYPLEIRSGTNEPPPLEPTQGHESPSHSTTQRQEPHQVETTEEQQLPQNQRNGLQRATKTRARQFFREFAADLENSRSSSNVNISLFTLALLTLVIPNSAQSIKCSNGTVHIKPQSNQYELCIGNECRKIINNTESGKYLLPISPDGSPVMVQIIENKEQTSLNETAFCKRPEFCDHHYLLSKSLLGNPHCWPTGAIATCAIFLYISTLLVLTFLLALRKSVPCHKSKRNTRNQQWHAQRIQNQLSVFELAPIRNNKTVAMCIICTLLSTTNACQHGYTRHSADLVCDQNNLCHYEYSRELLFNSIQSELCIELVYMNKSIGSIKFYKKPVQLKCTKLVESFTRPTQVQIYSVERCAQAGSCTIGKCQSVGTNETIPELKIAAKYPGYTGCFNGCGGLLCGCFMPQPSCVFYKIAHKPLSKRIFEIVKCLHWTPTIPLDIDMTILGKHKMLSLNITPYVTQKIDKLNITAISLQKSLFAATYSRFAIAENISYILPDEFKVPVECESAMQAQNHFSDCFNRVKCECGNSVQSCQCPEDSIRTLRATNRHTLPIQTPYGTITNERNQ